MWTSFMKWYLLSWYIDKWIISVEKGYSKGLYYRWPFKTIQILFCVTLLKILMEYWALESYLVLKTMSEVPGYRYIVGVQYQYNFWKVLGSISTDVDSSTDPGDLYFLLFPNIFQCWYFKCYFTFYNLKLFSFL